jgi:acyl-CoA dehydrogenase
MTAVAIDYPDEIRSLRDGLDSFIRTEVIARHKDHAALLSDARRKFEPDGRYTHEYWDLVSEVRTAAARAGYYTMCVPEDVGGAGMGYLAYFAAWEKIFHTCGMKYSLGHHVIGHWSRGPSFIMQMVTPEARKKIVPSIMAAEKIVCFAMSEPESGSDATQMKTRATPDGDGWRLNGSKIWISSSAHASWAIVFAVTDPEMQVQRKGGISAFLVPTDSTGYKLISLIKMFGLAGTEEGQLSFDNVRVEPWQLIGELHQGMKIGVKGVGFGRIYNSARGIGYGKWALDQALDYAKVRKTFGKVISSYQGVMFPLAEAAMRVHAAHLVALNAARLLDQGRPAVKELSMSKYMAVEAGYAAVDCAMQTFGAMGFTDELYLSEAFVALRKARVADGTKEILTRTIGKILLAGDTAL